MPTIDGYVLQYWGNICNWVPSRVASRPLMMANIISSAVAAQAGCAEYTLPKTNTAPENGGWKMKCPFGEAYFQGICLFQGVYTFFGVFHFHFISRTKKNGEGTWVMNDECPESMDECLYATSNG